MAVGVNTGVGPPPGRLSTVWASFTIATIPCATGLVSGRGLWGTGGTGGVPMTTGERMWVVDSCEVEEVEHGAKR